VACASTADCWAVGYDVNDSSVLQTLIEQWDGTSWTIVTSPNKIQSNGAALNNQLTSVTCASASQCWAVGYYNNNYYNNNNNGSFNQTLIEEFTIPVQLFSVVSEFTHGSAGTFDINLPLTGTPGIECRSSSALGDGNYQMIFTFSNPLTSVASATVASGTGSVSGSAIGPNPNQYTVNLTGVTNAQYITVSLTNVIDASGNSSSTVLGPSMGVLIGDVNATGRVDAADVSLVRQQTLQSITASNFREDINASGRIDASDVSIARQQTLTSLP
jgi:Dockerin type I domain